MDLTPQKRKVLTDRLDGLLAILKNTKEMKSDDKEALYKAAARASLLLLSESSSVIPDQITMIQVTENAEAIFKEALHQALSVYQETQSAVAEAVSEQIANIQTLQGRELIAAVDELASLLEEEPDARMKMIELKQLIKLC